MISHQPQSIVDCLIIGGGPAGLTASIYLARFLLDVVVIDAGNSRAKWIPCTHNHAGYPAGISGTDLVERMREQALQYGVRVERGTVGRLELAGDGFEAEWGSGPVSSRSVLIATGVQNRRPSMNIEIHQRLLDDGLLRYCPVCDGYEITDKKVAVIGTGESAVAEAVFLRSYTDDITLIASDGAHQLTDRDRRRLNEFTISAVDGPCHVVGGDKGMIHLNVAGTALSFDSAYPALGSDVNSDLAVKLGVETSNGAIVVDSHQRASVPGLYAAGDVVLGLDQISHAMGEGGVAATTIRNDLAQQRPIMRQARPC